MSKLDESKPYATELGLGGPRCYLQDGKRFNTQKRLIVEAEKPAEAEAPAAEPTDAPAEPAAEAASDEPVEALADMHWRELKKMVEAKGGEWIDKAAALEFLK